MPVVWPHTVTLQDHGCFNGMVRPSPDHITNLNPPRGRPERSPVSGDEISPRAPHREPVGPGPASSAVPRMMRHALRSCRSPPPRPPSTAVQACHMPPKSISGRISRPWARPSVLADTPGSEYSTGPLASWGLSRAEREHRSDDSEWPLWDIDDFVISFTVIPLSCLDTIYPDTCTIYPSSHWKSPSLLFFPDRSAREFTVLASLRFVDQPDIPETCAVATCLFAGKRTEASSDNLLLPLSARRRLHRAET